jgi:hypothetical protein
MLLNKVKWRGVSFVITKYNHKSYAASAPMMDKTRFVDWL